MIEPFQSVLRAREVRDPVSVGRWLDRRPVHHPIRALASSLSGAGVPNDNLRLHQSANPRHDRSV